MKSSKTITMKIFKSYGKNLNLPTMEESKDLLKKYNTPKHIINHCIGVMNFAVKLAEKINANSKNNNDLEVNIDLVKKASLLHDLLRVIDFKEFERSNFMQDVTEEDMKIWKEQIQEFKKGADAKKNHSYAAYNLLKDSYPELANCILNHDYTRFDTANGWHLEDFIVSYADKRVRNHGPIPLKERFDNGHKRYEKRIKELGATDEKLKIFQESKKRIDGKFFELEKDLFELAGVERL